MTNIVETKNKHSVLTTIVCMRLTGITPLRNGPDKPPSTRGFQDSCGVDRAAPVPELLVTPEMQEVIKLATAIRNGDKRAEAEMAKKYEPAMRRILKTRANCYHDVDDLVNEVWLRVIPKLRDGDLKNLAALPSYLNAFARRVAANYIKSTNLRESKKSLEEVDKTKSNEAGPYARICWEQAFEITCALIKELRMDRDRQILFRYLIQEEEKETLCKELNLSAVAFDKVLCRARDRFRALAKPIIDTTGE